MKILLSFFFFLSLSTSFSQDQKIIVKLIDSEDQEITYYSGIARAVHKTKTYELNRDDEGLFFFKLPEGEYYFEFKIKGKMIKRMVEVNESRTFEFKI